MSIDGLIGNPPGRGEVDAAPAADISQPGRSAPRPRSLYLGLALITMCFLVAIFSPLLQTHDPLELNVLETGLPPSTSHYFGTDSLGYDVYSRVIAAAKLDLFIAVVAVTCSLLIGMILGIAAGVGRRWMDEGIMRCIDAIQGFPRFILAIAVAYGIGAGIGAIIVATVILNVPSYTRLLRASIRSIKASDYIVAAEAIGNSRVRVIWRHVLPNAMGPIGVQASLQPGWVIVEAAGLSFIGLGVQRPTAEWGLMLSDAVQEFFQGYWWTYVFPGLALFIAVVAFNLTGEGLGDLRRRR
jgi:peptide/nickel transport system permease protein